MVRAWCSWWFEVESLFDASAGRLFSVCCGLPNLGVFFAPLKPFPCQPIFMPSVGQPFEALGIELYEFLKLCGGSLVC